MNDDTARRRLILALGASALATVQGCATSYAVSLPNSKVKEIEGAVVLTDTIVALGKLDPDLGATVGQPLAVAFLGKKQTYVLDEGGIPLLRLAQQLDNDRLALLPDSHELYLRDQQVWGRVRLHYTPLPRTAPVAQLEKERALLLRLDFLPERDGGQTAVIYVSGVIRPALTLPPHMAALPHAPDIVFRAPPTTERTPNLGKFALLPVALVVDILTLPLYGAGLTAWAVLDSASRAANGTPRP